MVGPLSTFYKKFFVLFRRGGRCTSEFYTTCLLSRFSPAFAHDDLWPGYNIPPVVSQQEGSALHLRSCPKQMERVLYCYRFVTFCNQIVTFL